MVYLLVFVLCTFNVCIFAMETGKEELTICALTNIENNNENLFDRLKTMLKEVDSGFQYYKTEAYTEFIFYNRFKLPQIIRNFLSIGCVDLMIAKGHDGNTIFHDAARNIDKNVCSLLLEHAAIKTFLLINKRNKKKSYWVPKVIMNFIFGLAFPYCNTYTKEYCYKGIPDIDFVLKKKNQKKQTAYDIICYKHQEAKQKLEKMQKSKKQRQKSGKNINIAQQEIHTIKQIKRILCVL